MFLFIYLLYLLSVGVNPIIDISNVIPWALHPVLRDAQGTADSPSPPAAKLPCNHSQAISDHSLCVVDLRLIQGQFKMTFPHKKNYMPGLDHLLITHLFII